MEQQRAYVMKIEAAAPAEIEIACIAKIAARTVEAWRAHRDANASQAKRETRDDKGPASHPTLGVALLGLNLSDRLSSSSEELPVSVIGLLIHWFEDERIEGLVG